MSKRFGLIPSMIPRNKRWAIAVDYLDQLSEEELDFLDQFNREFHEGAIRKGDPDALHNTDELRRSCYLHNTKQTRDLFGIKRAAGLLSSGDESHREQKPIFDTLPDDESIEDTIIDKIDAFNYQAGSLVALAFQTLDEVRRDNGQSEGRRKTNGGNGTA